MKQRWRSLGRLFQSDGQRDWMISHASCPQAQHLSGDVFRIWFAPRDRSNRSHCGWLELDITRPARIIRLAETPALAPGGLGAFDEAGAMFSWLHESGGAQRLYYTGWTIGDTVPFRNAIGLAVADDPDALVFERASVGPVLDRSAADPYFVGNPCVVEAGDLWHLWYLSGTRWRAPHNGTPARADYDLRHATSADGQVWQPHTGPALGFMHPGEMAIARPAVVIERDLFRMWFCYRGETYPYRIGYAESRDGAAWKRRDDEIVFTPSGADWDSDMICYPHVFSHRGRHYMLYCGNGFSAAGFGLAVLET